MQADLTEICNNSAMNNGYPSYHFRQRPNNSATILASSEQASPLGWATACPRGPSAPICTPTYFSGSLRLLHKALLQDPQHCSGAGGSPKEIFDGANAARNLLRDLQTQHADVNWAMISPPACLGADGGFSEERTGQYRLGSDELLMVGDAPAGISVADLSIAIADDVEKKAHLHQRFTAAAV